MHAYAHRRAQRPRRMQDDTSPVSLPSISSPPRHGSIPPRLIEVQMEMLLTPPQEPTSSSTHASPRSSDSGLSLALSEALGQPHPGADFPQRLIEAQMELTMEPPSPQMFAAQDSSEGSATDSCPPPQIPSSLNRHPSPTSASAARNPEIHGVVSHTDGQEARNPRGGEPYFAPWLGLMPHLKWRMTQTAFKPPHCPDVTHSDRTETPLSLSVSCSSLG